MRFSDVELVSAIEEMSLDDAADLLEDMPAGVVKRVLEKSSRQTRESLNKLLNYPESSAGSLMTPEYVRLRQEMTVGDAFAAIRKQGENAETVYTCYVVERNRLKGVVSARSLLLADPSTPITDIMDDNVVTVKVTDDQEYRGPRDAALRLHRDACSGQRGHVRRYHHHRRRHRRPDR